MKAIKSFVRLREQVEIRNYISVALSIITQERGCWNHSHQSEYWIWSHWGYCGHQLVLSTVVHVIACGIVNYSSSNVHHFPALPWLWLTRLSPDAPQRSSLYGTSAKSTCFSSHPKGGNQLCLQPALCCINNIINTMLTIIANMD